MAAQVFEDTRWTDQKGEPIPLFNIPNRAAWRWQTQKEDREDTPAKYKGGKFIYADGVSFCILRVITCRWLRMKRVVIAAEHSAKTGD